MREAKLAAASHACNDAVGASIDFARPLGRPGSRRNTTSFSVTFPQVSPQVSPQRPGLPAQQPQPVFSPAREPESVPGEVGGCDSGSPENDLARANADAAAAARRAKGISDAEHRQGEATKTGNAHISATDSVESPGDGNLRDASWENSLNDTAKHQTKTLGAQQELTAGLQDEYKWRLLQLRADSAALAEGKPRPLMAGTEMESPWTGYSNELQPKRVASGLLQIHATQRGSGGKLLNSQNRGSAPSSFTETDEAESRKEDAVAHEMQIVQGSQNVDLEAMYLKNVKAIQKRHCQDTANGEGLKRPEMMSAEQPKYLDAKDKAANWGANTAKWGETLPTPKGRGPEIGFGMEVPSPFHGLTPTGEPDPTSVGVAQFPGYEAESFPEETEASIPVVALHAAVLAPQFPPNGACANSFPQEEAHQKRQKCKEDQMRSGSLGAFL